jgi:hypothetical protein
MSDDIATVYVDRDNTFTMTLKKNDISLTEEEMNAITKVEIKYQGTYYNSIDNAAGFDITVATAKVKITPKALLLAESITGELVEVIIYDSASTNGIVWDQFTLVNKNDATV